MEQAPAPLSDSASPSSTRRRDGPRFALVAWLLTTLAMLVVSTACAIVVAVVVAVRAVLAGERSTERITELTLAAVESPAFLWVSLVVSQLTLLVCAALACRWLRVPARERLGLVTSGLSPLQALALGLATAVPFALGLGAATLASEVFGSADESFLGLQRMWAQGGRGASASWVLLIALAPGIAEELVYRGLLQRGLLQRWSPAAAILTSTLLFALVHGEPAAMVFIVPIGLWFGLVAWRTGSIWPTILMHAGINGLWTASMMAWHREPALQSSLTAIGCVLLALGLVAFPFAVRALRGAEVRKRAPSAPDSASATWRLAGAACAAAALAYLFLPPELPREQGTELSQRSSAPSAPSLAELEASVASSATCPAIGDTGAVELELHPGAATRVQLPTNLAGVDEVIVQLDAQARTVWLAYSGERSGKGVRARPRGIVEQLVSGQPTLLHIELSEGHGPVLARLTLEDDASTKDTLLARALDAGWAVRGRK
jgi:membrane protease YdiL (CAAX protease family)